MKSRIVRMYQQGGPEVLMVEYAPVDEPGEGEIRIKVEAIGLNRAEILFREGRYLETPPRPSRIGYEAAGIVDAVGSGVTGLKVGDRVSTIPSFSMGRYGVYGEHAIVPAYAAATYPERLSATEGASIWMAYITAYGALIDLANVGAHDTVLVTAATSSVGRAAIQIAKQAGATVIATTRSQAKQAALLADGTDHVIIASPEHLAERVMSVTSGKGASVVFDPIGGPWLSAIAEAAAPGATIIVYGFLSPEPTLYPVMPAMMKGLTVRGYVMLELVNDAPRLSRCKAHIGEGLGSGVLKPIIDRTFPLDQIADAHRYMESNQQNGKIVVTV